MAASEASERSSCTSTSICLPLMPPAALTSSAAILMPLTDEMPKFAVEPVSDIKTPIRTLSPPPCGWHALSKLAMTIEAIRMRFIQVLTGLEVSDELKSELELLEFLVFIRRRRADQSFDLTVIALNNSFQALTYANRCKLSSTSYKSTSSRS